MEMDIRTCTCIAHRIGNEQTNKEEDRKSEKLFSFFFPLFCIVYAPRFR